MNQIPKIQKTETGKSKIIISEKESEFGFSIVANRTIRALNGKIETKIDSPFERHWNILIDGKKYSIFWESMLSDVSILADDGTGEIEIENIFKKLKKHKIKSIHRIIEKLLRKMDFGNK